MPHGPPGKVPPLPVKLRGTRGSVLHSPPLSARRNAASAIEPISGKALVRAKCCADVTILTKTTQRLQKLSTKSVLCPRCSRFRDECRRVNAPKTTNVVLKNEMATVLCSTRAWSCGFQLTCWAVPLLNAPAEVDSRPGSFATTYFKKTPTAALGIALCFLSSATWIPSQRGQDAASRIPGHSFSKQEISYMRINTCMILYPSCTKI